MKSLIQPHTLRRAETLEAWKSLHKLNCLKKKKKKCIKENNQQFIQVFVLRSSKDIGVTLKE